MIKVELKIKELKDNEVEMEVDIKKIFPTNNENITLEEIEKRLKLDQKEQNIFTGEKFKKEDIQELIELLKKYINKIYIG